MIISVVFRIIIIPNDHYGTTTVEGRQHINLHKRTFVSFLQIVMKYYRLPLNSVILELRNLYTYSIWYF